MNPFVIFNLIFCALGLYLVKYVGELYRAGILREKLEKAARKALRFTFYGLVAASFAIFAISQFSWVRDVGFAFFSAEAVASIRLIMQAILDTNSVYAALQIFACVALLLVEFSLIFSIVGFFVVKQLVVPQALECNRVGSETTTERHAEVAAPHVFRKIFLNFANLRI